MRTHYQVLEVAETATLPEIRAAYKRLAFQYHPDRNAGSHFHEDRFKEVANAYTQLSDPDSRALYDYRLRSLRRPSTIGGGVPGYNNTSPYGGYGTYQPGRAPRPGRSQTTYSPPLEKTRPWAKSHHVFIAITLMACIAMSSLWFADLMARQTARRYLEAGDYITALQYDTTFGEAWYAKGRHLAMIGRTEEALRDINQGIKLADQVPQAWYFDRGRLREASGLTEDAIRDYELAYEVAELQDSAQIRRGKMAVRVEQDACKGLQWLRKSSAASLSSPATAFVLGQAALGCQQPALAEKAFQLTADASYLPGESYLMMGYSLQQQGEASRACIAWDLALNNGQLQADTLIRQLCKGDLDVQHR